MELAIGGTGLGHGREVALLSEDSPVLLRDGAVLSPVAPGNSRTGPARMFA